MSDWNWGSFRSPFPLSRHFGFDRGGPVDRYFIEKFLATYQLDIVGRTLEIGDDGYTRKFGGARTTQRDILHVHDGNPAATIVGDLVSADNIPSAAFDCLVLTQTLHLIYNLDAAIGTIARILRPGGVVLATFPGISQISVDEWSKTWSWGLSGEVARELFAKYFPADHLTVTSWGNTLAATCFLQGLSAQELTAAQLDFVEPECEMLIGVRAVQQRP